MKRNSSKSIAIQFQAISVSVESIHHLRMLLLFLFAAHPPTAHRGEMDALQLIALGQKTLAKRSGQKSRPNNFSATDRTQLSAPSHLLRRFAVKKVPPMPRTSTERGSAVAASFTEAAHTYFQHGVITCCLQSIDCSEHCHLDWSDILSDEPMKG